MLEILRSKQEAFLSFADKSVVGEESLEIKEGEDSEASWITQMVKSEKERLSKNNSI